MQTVGTESPNIVVAAGGSLSIVAWESSQPHVEAWESSQPHVEARESSQPHVVAWGSSQPHVVAWGSSQPHVVARGSSQPHVVAWGSSQPHVVARGSSQPHVEAWGSSQPHVEAWESSQPHVEAWGSSQPHVEARGTVQLSVRGAVAVVASAMVAICVLGGNPTIDGGGFVTRVDRSTPEKWCEYYGIEMADGYALLYKAVRDDYLSRYKMSYAPGTCPEAPDWDGPARECGGGLHFSPCVAMARAFDDEATRYLACPVLLAEMVVHPDGNYPEKCKAKRVALPCWEVDEDGTAVADAVVNWPPKER